jgi:chaperonin GroEL
LIKSIKALDKLSGANEDENMGIQIVRKSLESPLRTIADNAGVDGSVVFQKVSETNGEKGYNARTNVYEDLKKSGVIDPTKVTRIAIINAGSIASMVLTTECVVNDKKEEAAAGGGHHHGMPGGGMGGMM